jgi:putative Mg2+ transporter-C (MgtC) family protein
MSIDDLEVTLRLLAAVAAGAVFGINRDLRGKPTGVRTLGLVALGAALVTVATTTMPEFSHSPDALSRVVQGTIQGIMAGIGFWVPVSFSIARPTRRFMA